MHRIYLVGFMGAGKSTVGRELSLILHRPLMDLDAEIEKAEGITVREIFARFGEPRFRQIEREHLKRISEASPAIVALGGGAWRVLVATRLRERRATLADKGAGARARAHRRTCKNALPRR